MAKNTVPPAVLSQTKNLRLRESMLLGSSLEGGWNPPYPVGDSGTSFGPYQMHEGGALTELGLSPSQAENAKTATKAMLPSYASAVNQISDKEWQNNPQQAAEQAAVIAEGPAQDYYTSRGTGTVNANWQDVETVLKGKKSTAGMPAQEAQLTSAGEGVSSWLSGLQSLAGGNPFPVLGDLFSAPSGASIGDFIERAGLILFGGILVIVGIIVFARPGEKIQKGVKLGTQVTATGKTFGAFQGAKQADIARRQQIADRSLAIGERNAAIKEKREARLEKSKLAKP